MRRNLAHIDNLIASGASLSKLSRQRYRRLVVVIELIRQQQWMYNEDVRRIDDRIVSLAQPYVRPIVRGKAGTPVEFGAKIAVSCVDGKVFLERLSWDNFNESVDLPEQIEKYRRYWTMGNTEYLIGAEKWRCLKSIGMVESQRTINGTTSTERRYYLLSLESDAHKFAESIRNHWSIENQLHWILDVGFKEDASQCCRGYSAENLAVIRHIGLNLLSRDKKARSGSRQNESRLAGIITILSLFLKL